MALSVREQHPGASAIASLREEGQRLLLAMIGEPRRSLFDGGQFEELLKQAGWKTIQYAPAAAPGELQGTLLLAQ